MKAGPPLFRCMFAAAFMSLSPYNTNTAQHLMERAKTQVSINDSLPTSSPSPRSTLIGLACILGFIALAVLYGYVIGF